MGWNKLVASDSRIPSKKRMIQRQYGNDIFEGIAENIFKYNYIKESFHMQNGPVLPLKL